MSLINDLLRGFAIPKCNDQLLQKLEILQPIQLINQNLSEQLNPVQHLINLVSSFLNDKNETKRETAQQLLLLLFEFFPVKMEIYPETVLQNMYSLPVKMIKQLIQNLQKLNFDKVLLLGFLSEMLLKTQNLTDCCTIETAIIDIMPLVANCNSILSESVDGIGLLFPPVAMRIARTVTNIFTNAYLDSPYFRTLQGNIKAGQRSPIEVYQLIMQTLMCDKRIATAAVQLYQISQMNLDASNTLIMLKNMKLINDPISSIKCVAVRIFWQKLDDYIARNSIIQNIIKLFYATKDNGFILFIQDNKVASTFDIAGIIGTCERNQCSEALFTLRFIIRMINSPEQIFDQKTTKLLLLLYQDLIQKNIHLSVEALTFCQYLDKLGRSDEFEDFICSLADTWTARLCNQPDLSLIDFDIHGPIRLETLASNIIQISQYQHIHSIESWLVLECRIYLSFLCKHLNKNVNELVNDDIVNVVPEPKHVEIFAGVQNFLCLAPCSLVCKSTLAYLSAACELISIHSGVWQYLVIVSFRNMISQTNEVDIMKALILLILNKQYNKLNVLLTYESFFPQVVLDITFKLLPIQVTAINNLGIDQLTFDKFLEVDLFSVLPNFTDLLQNEKYHKGIINCLTTSLNIMSELQESRKCFQYILLIMIHLMMNKKIEQSQYLFERLSDKKIYRFIDEQLGLLILQYLFTQLDLFYVNQQVTNIELVESLILKLCKNSTYFQDIIYTRIKIYGDKCYTLLSNIIIEHAEYQLYFTKLASELCQSTYIQFCKHFIQIAPLDVIEELFGLNMVQQQQSLIIMLLIFESGKVKQKLEYVNKFFDWLILNKVDVSESIERVIAVLNVNHNQLQIINTIISQQPYFQYPDGDLTLAQLIIRLIQILSEGERKAIFDQLIVIESLHWSGTVSLLQASLQLAMKLGQQYLVQLLQKNLEKMENSDGMQNQIRALVCARILTQVDGYQVADLLNHAISKVIMCPVCLSQLYLPYLQLRLDEGNLVEQILFKANKLIDSNVRCIIDPISGDFELNIFEPIERFEISQQSIWLKMQHDSLIFLRDEPLLAVKFYKRFLKDGGSDLRDAYLKWFLTEFDCRKYIKDVFDETVEALIDNTYLMGLFLKQLKKMI